MDYDMTIHQNPDAQAWAKMFVAQNPNSPHDEATMIGWFANAMMAMHDHLTGQTVLNGDHAQYLIDQQSQEEAKDTITQIDMNVLVKEWIAACDAALEWADANARWFDISTAPKDGTLVMFHVPSRTNPLIGRADDYWAGAYWLADVTHWRPLPPPPSNLPLPEPLEALGAVLRRVKRGE